MTRHFDIIVIGDSIEGAAIIKKLISTKLQVAYISQNFENSQIDLLSNNITAIKAKVLFIDYKKRLFGCYLDNNERIYCTHLIAATGISHQPFMLGLNVIPNVYHSLKDIPADLDTDVALILGHQNSDAKLALAIAKKFKQVYLCTEHFDFGKFTKLNQIKLSEASNITVLPNSVIQDISVSDNNLKYVKFDNYAIIKCSAIFKKTEVNPETSFLPDNLIDKTDTGYLRVNSNAESVKVPKCFAIGSCCANYNYKMLQTILKIIQDDFKEV